MDSDDVVDVLQAAGSKETVTLLREAGTELALPGKAFVTRGYRLMSEAAPHVSRGFCYPTRGWEADRITALA